MIVLDSLFGFQEPFVALGGDYMAFLAHGGRGSGKTWAGACKAMLYGVNYPGALICITAPTFRMLYDSALKVFKEVLETHGLKERQHWEYNETRKELNFFFSNTQYLFRSTDEPQTLRGRSLAAFWMDEGSRSSREAFTNLVASLRQGRKPDGTGVYPLMGWVTTTPAGKAHWLYDVFFVNQDERFRYLTFPAATKDNPYGGRELYEAMVSLLGGDASPYARQEMYGEFTVSEGLVFPEYDPEIHDASWMLLPQDEWPIKPRFVMAGVDFGWSAPSAIHVEGYTPIDSTLGHRFLIDEFYKPKMSTNALALACSHFADKYGCRYFLCDSAEPRLIRELRRFRVGGEHKVRARPVEKGRGSVLYRKLLCASALSARHNGKPTFHVSPTKVPHWKFEISNYTERPQRDGANPDERPQEEDDHAMSAWGYAEVGIAKWFMRGSDKLQQLSMRL